VADVTFIPTFHHVAWVDNRDRVQAGGPNGFNIRFSSIETDLHSISTAVGGLDAAIGALGQKPPPVQQKLTLAPAMVPLTPPGWSMDSSGNAFRPAGQTGVSGILAAPLLDGVQLVSLRALGQNSGSGIVTVALFRSPLAGSVSPPDRLARVSGDTNPFDATIAVDSSMSRVDMSTFRYFVIAACTNSAPADVITISAIQIAYMTG
jgi:hypothetical protein